MYSRSTVLASRYHYYYPTTLTASIRRIQSRYITIEDVFYVLQVMNSRPYVPNSVGKIFRFNRIGNPFGNSLIKVITIAQLARGTNDHADSHLTIDRHTSWRSSLRIFLSGLGDGSQLFRRPLVPRLNYELYNLPGKKFLL